MKSTTDVKRPGLRRISILATAGVLALFAILLLTRRATMETVARFFGGAAPEAPASPRAELPSPSAAADRTAPEASRKPEPNAPHAPDKTAKAMASYDTLAAPIAPSPGGGPDKFVIRDRNVNAFFTPRGMTLSILDTQEGTGPKGFALNWGLEGAAEVQPRPLKELPTKINRLIGKQENWQSNLPSYSQVSYENVRPGVDLLMESQLHGVKYTVQVKPGADVKNLKFRYEGADQVQVNPEGTALEIVTGLGTLVEKDLRCWQDRPTGRTAVEARYLPAGRDAYFIEVGQYDPSLPLTIDPWAVWATFIGGSISNSTGSDWSRGIARDPATGNIFVGGYTNSANFPTTVGAYSTGHSVLYDCFVTKFTDNGASMTLVWSTYLGGNDSDYLYGLKLDASANVYVTGYTYSSNFPTTFGAHRTSPYVTGGSDAFVTKLNGADSSLAWSTYLGGTSTDVAYALAVDASYVYITGYTYSTDMATLGAFDTTSNGGADVFVTKLNASNSAEVFTTYLGGDSTDYGYGITVDTSGYIYVTGATYIGTAVNFPTTANAYRTTHSGGYDVYVTKLLPSGAGPLQYSTLIGGTSSDYSAGIALDTASPVGVYITGRTSSTNWPTTAGVQFPASAGGQDAFIAKFNPLAGTPATTLVYSEYLGGSGTDYGTAIRVGSGNVAYVTGYTNSSNFPVTVGAYDTSWNGGYDVFITRVNATATGLFYSTFVGGASDDYAFDITETAAYVWLAGYTNSVAFPTTAGAYDSVLNGQEAFLFRFDALQNGSTALMWSTFLGGANASGSTYGRAAAIGNVGNVFVATQTYTFDFPTTFGAFDTTYGGSSTYYDVTVTKLDSSGSTVMWSTFLGGSSTDYVSQMVLNNAGEPFLTGYTNSTDFPLWNAFQGFQGSYDAFVTRLKSDGSGLIYSSYVGGSLNSDYAYGIAVDSGNAYITGETYSSNYPATVGDLVWPGLSQAFVTKINTNSSGAASHVWSRWIGGALGYETGWAIAVDSSGNSYVAGWTSSSDLLATAGAYDTTFDAVNGEDLFVCKIRPNGATMDWLTFLGGSSYETAKAIAVDSTGAVIVAGSTSSADFPVTGIQTLHGAYDDGFVSKLSSNGSSLLWSTFLGGNDTDQINSIALDAGDNVYVTGYTYSTDFPMVGGFFQSTYIGSADAFATRINSDGLSLSWSTYLGGTRADYGYSIACMPEGHVIVVAETSSTDIPVGGGGFDITLNGYTDAWVIRIDNLAPSSPSSPAQYRSDGTTSITIGGATNQTTVVLKGISTDAEGDKYKLQVELRPVGTAFTNTVMYESGYVASGVTNSVIVSGLTAGVQYHWQMRSIDLDGVYSSFTGFGGNTENPPTNPAAIDFQVDQTAPSISISAPSGTGTYYAATSPVAVSGSASDAVGLLNVTWSNAATAQNGTATGTTAWSVAAIPLAGGSNVITMTATDIAGNTNTAVINVIYDPTIPTATITQPTNASTYTTAVSPLTTLAGTATDNIAVSTVQWRNNGGVYTSATGTASWSVSSITLTTGLNTIDVKATDLAGNFHVDTLTVTYDPTPPIITITGPTSNPTYSTKLSSIVLTGTCSDAVTSVVLINAVNTTTSTGWGLAGGTSFTTPSIPLALGANVINMIAYDAANNSGTDTITVTYDPTPPTVAITTNGGANFTTSASSIALAGTAADSGGSGLNTVTWSNSATGGNGTAGGTSSWSVGSIGLQAGANLITVTASDNATNSTPTTITVTYDPTPPNVAITTNGGANFATTASSVNLAGTASDNVSVASIAWQIDGGGYVTTGVAGTTSWTITGIALSAGAHTINVRSTDTAGNSAVTAITVTRDNTAPTVAITSPSLDPFYTTVSSLAFAGTSSDAVGIQIVEWRNTTTSLTWFPVSSGTTSWTITGITMVAGSNAIEVRATDLAGNQTVATRQVIRDNSAPSVAITTNGGVNFSTNATPLSLAGTSSDAAPGVVSIVEWSNNAGPFNTTSGTTAWTASIPLSAGSNAITVRATDGAGNQSTTSITVTLDQTNPTVAITTNGGAAFATTGATVNLAGTAGDNAAVASIAWQIDGGGYGTTGVSGTTAWTITGIALSAGAHTINVRATDTAGNTAVAAIVVTRDNTLPVVTITTNGGANYFTTGTTTNLAGTASDNVSVASIAWQIDGGGYGTTGVAGTTAWTITGIALSAGTHTIDVRATDTAGNTSTDSIAVTRDNTAPAIVITTNGGANFTTNATPLALAGTSSDAAPGVVSIVEWSNNAGPFNPTTGTTAWTASIPLSAGANAITVRVTDGAGNQSTTSITVTLDQTNPAVAITTNGGADFATTGATVNLAGTASDNVSVASIAWQIDGGGYGTTGVSGTTAWTITGIALSAGAHTINVRATDTAGNIAVAAIVVTRDNTAPVVTITTNGGANYFTTGTTTNLAGTASDNVSVASIAWQIDGGGYGTTGVAGTTAWTITGIALSAGTHTIDVRATDTAGNTFSDSIAVTRDNTAPAIVITTNGGANFTTNATPLALAGTSSDTAPGVVSIVEWSNNGGAFAAATGTTAWTASIALASGTNTVTVRVTDAAGNTGTAVIVVTYDSGAPTVTITSPTSSPTYITNNPSLTTLAGTSSDASGIQVVKWRNNGAAYVNATGTTSWSVASITLVPGTNTIDVQATDNGGNPSVATIVVTLDQTNPAVAITTNGGSDFSTTASSVNLAGTSSDNVSVASIDWRVDGGAFSAAGVAGTTSWTITGIPLATAAAHTINVRATDTAGNTSMAAIVVTRDNTIPTIVVTGPASGGVRNTTPVTVSGTAADVGSSVASVGWSRLEGGGASGSASGTTSWSASVPLVVGLNTFTFTSTDAAGNASTGAVWTVTLDQSAPVVTITTNGGSDFATLGATVNLAGTASDNISVATIDWQVDGGGFSTTGVAGTTSWTITGIPLATAAAHTIQVRATDTAGNSFVRTIIVTRDNTIPTITVTSPASGGVRNTTPVTVNGTAADVGSSVASVSWSRAEGGGASGSASGTTAWNASIPLVAGTNTVTFTSTDAAGNASTPLVWTVTLDQTAPGVTITTNGGASFPTTASSVNLAGTSTDNIAPASIDWRVDGGGFSAAGVGGTPASWTITGLPLATEGAHVIDVRVTDTAGNTSTATITVTRDNTAPTVTITSPTSVGPPAPAPHFTTGASPLTLGGSSSDAGSGIASATWSRLEGGGDSGAAAGSTNWSANVTLTPGFNTITITVTDGAGNTGTDSIVVDFSASSATVEITTPTTNASFNTATTPITIAGTAAHGTGISLVEWQKNGGGYSSAGVTGTTSWSVPIALTAGSNVIDIRATPVSGSQGTDTITVIYDPTAPTLAISTNGGANFATNVTPAVLAGTAADNVGGSGLASVTWANAATAGTGTAAGTATWSAPVPLTAGANVITFTAKDNVNNSQNAAITVTYDPTPPALAITTNGGANFAVAAASTNLAGTSSDNLTVSTIDWRIDGGAFSATGVGGTVSAWTITGIALSAGAHVLDVRATDTAGNTTLKSITVTRDTTAPTVAITSPTAAATYVTNATPLVLGGTASDNLSLASVSWSNAATGGTGTASGTTTWTAAGITLATGANAITVTATDSVGNTGTALITVTYDPTLPVVTITGPTSNPTLEVSAGTVALSGTASDNVLVSTVTWSNSTGGSGAAAGAPGVSIAWTIASISLVPGPNVITVTATDSAGNTSTDVITVTRDATNPTVAISTPTASATYLSGTTPLTIGGTASDNVSVSLVEWRNNGGSYAPASGTSTWSASVALTGGANVIEVRAKDGAGNFSALATLTVTYDNIAPAISISTNGGANFATNTSPITITAVASDASGVSTVKWTNAATGGAGSATLGANWDAQVPLAIGSNFITLTATDAAGNTAASTITVTLDTTVPTVTITGPTSSPTLVVAAGPITLDGTMSDNVAVATVTWVNSTGGNGTAILGAGTWSAAGIALAAGANVLTVTATDSAGNTSTDVLTVTVDGTIPTVTITTPTSSPTFLTGAANLTVGGTAADNVGVALVEWQNNGGAFAPAAGTTAWSASVPLVGGANVINVRSKDTAGNFSALKTLTVTRDNGAPTIAITTNGGANFATNASPTPLAGNAADPALTSVTWTNAATGGSGAATGAAAWTASVPLAIGANLITMTASDAAGNTASAVITVTLDPTAPAVTITGPTSQPTFVSAAATLTLDGTMSDNVGIAGVAWFNSANSTSGAATLAVGTWSAPGIGLVLGTNVITVTATDTANNTSTDVITVTLDQTVPTVTVTSPTSSPTYLTGAASLLVGGTAADNVGVALVEWRNNGGAYAPAAGTTSWSASVNLAVGANVIDVRATDTAGNVSAIDTITVTRDTTTPSITITSPTPAATWATNASPIALGGTAADDTSVYGVSWTNAATGGAGSATGTTAWTASIPLAIGVNTLTVTVTDSAGNTSTDSIDVTFDVTLPNVTISAPTSSPTFVTSGLTVDLGGSFSDNVAVASIAWTNAGNLTSGPAVQGAGTWTATGITLAVGSNVITVTATDTAGNLSTDVITVTRDNTNPTIAITGPTAAPVFVTNASPLLIAGTAADNVSVGSVGWTNSEAGTFGTAAGTTSWSASIALVAGVNTITVTATDAAGGTTSDVITVTYDALPPTVAITSPTGAPAYLTNLAPVVLGGTASDAGLGGLSTVTWSNLATGGTGTATGTAAWSATVPLTNGVNSIIVTATDAAGNSSTDSIDVTFDAVVPSVTITSPTSLPTAITSAPTITLGGSSTDNVSVATVSWLNAANGASGSTGITASWTSAAIPLAAGENLITVTATDSAGNSSSDTITVRQDSVPPALAFTVPTSGPVFLTNATPLAIAGTATDDVAVASVAWSRAEGGGLAGAAIGADFWSASVPLVPGTNTITVTVTDTAGNTAFTVLTATLDSTLPTVTPSGPTTISTATASVILSGTASDDLSLATVTWFNAASGGTGTATGTAAWSAAVPLTPGTNIITVTVRDSAGNIATSTYTVIHDTQAPTITISAPTSAATYNSPTSPLTVGGTASDNVAVTTVTWTNFATGTSGTAAGTTAWSDSIPLIEGSNQITVTATDAVGNTSSDTITVSYDPTPPTITITAPTVAPTYSTTTNPLDISGTASDNTSLTGVTWSNTTTGTTGTAAGTAVWTFSVPLASGPNVIVVTATDSVGNTSTDTITVTYDVTPPVVVIVSPAPPSLVTTVRPLVISGSATDNVGVTTVTWSNNLTGGSGTATFADPNWNASIPLVPGVNLITIRAADALGNIGSATLSVDYSHETTPPGIAIVNPTAAPTFLSALQLLSFGGTASDNVGVAQVTWLNRTTRVYGTAVGTTSWTAEVPLADGANVIEFTAWDLVGNIATATITVTWTATPETNVPSVSITAPTASDTFDTTVSPLYLEAEAIDDTGIVSVRWTNQDSYGDGSAGWGTIWYANIPLTAGVNYIVVTATDPSGNVSTDYITVNYNPPVGDPVAPLVNIVTPSGTVNLSTPSVDLAGTASDNNQVLAVTYFNSATGAYASAVGTTAWSITGVALNVGVNVITVRALDPSGNYGEKTLVAVYTPPAAAAPVAPTIPAGALCGCLGLEVLLPLAFIGLWRRRRTR